MFKYAIMFALIISILSHPTYYLGVNQKCDQSTKILSWHIHIVFSLTNSEIYQRAMELHQKAREYFKDYVGPDCNGRFDNGRLCFIYDHDFDKILMEGPFPSGEWSMFVPVSYFNLVIPWFALNRGEFSYLVHPNTGCMWEDHSEWSFWVGQSWPIDLTIFEKGKQISEFNHNVGDIANPSCLKNAFVCSSPEYDGPALACCEGFTCKCNSSSKQCRCQEYQAKDFLSLLN